MNLQESIRRILREETEDGMKDIMFDMFDENTKGTEFYEYDNSLWMIIPETKEWVFEIEHNLTLWYNLPFFEKIYKYVSLDVIDNQHYITEWVEDIIKTGVRNTYRYVEVEFIDVDNILKKGVRNTKAAKNAWQYDVEDILNTGQKLQ
jgi:hypothetical protein